MYTVVLPIPNTQSPLAVSVEYSKYVRLINKQLVLNSFAEHAFEGNYLQNFDYISCCNNQTNCLAYLSIVH